MSTVSSWTKLLSPTKGFVCPSVLPSRDIHPFFFFCLLPTMWKHSNMTPSWTKTMNSHQTENLPISSSWASKLQNCDWWISTIDELAQSKESILCCCTNENSKGWGTETKLWVSQQSKRAMQAQLSAHQASSRELYMFGRNITTALRGRQVLLLSLSPLYKRKLRERRISNVLKITSDLGERDRDYRDPEISTKEGDTETAPSCSCLLAAAGATPRASLPYLRCTESPCF